MKRSLCLILVAAVCAACGGSDSSEIEFSGTLFSATGSSLAQTAQSPLANVEVCALGLCDLTDETGRWSFIVGDDDFEGGAVLFSFRGASLVATSETPSLPADVDLVEIDFLALSEDTVVISEIRQTDDETVEDELDELGEDIQDESENAVDSIEEEISEL